MSCSLLTCNEWCLTPLQQAVVVVLCMWLMDTSALLACLAGAVSSSEAFSSPYGSSHCLPGILCFGLSESRPYAAALHALLYDL